MHLCNCLYPRILVSLGSCVRACILASLYPHILRFMYCRYLLVSSHPHILRFLRVTLYPHILLSLGSCTLCVCCYPRIFISSNPRFIYSRSLLVSSHPHILIYLGSFYSGCFLVSSHPHILISLSSCTVPWVLIGILAFSHPHTHNIHFLLIKFSRISYSVFIGVFFIQILIKYLKANILNKWAALPQQFFLIALRHCLL